ncbi:unnamed protein product [Knipowitschia caucasica]|uniref:C-type lectin domain-containing protein n=1 Tax=Knipowitschia caucasica TaxID=637954 RepID=A0AAV2K9A1_KNICA
MLLSSALLLLLGVSLGSASPSGISDVTLQRGGCPAFWFSFKDRCYKYVSTRLTWGDAEVYCQSQNSNLVSIRDDEENDFVKTLIQNFDHTQGMTWIGLSDNHKEGAWMWSDGYPVTFNMWFKGEPNNSGGNEHCGEINAGPNKEWNDHPCSLTYPSVCATRRDKCQQPV